jgi:hypothetical protein
MTLPRQRLAIEQQKNKKKKNKRKNETYHALLLQVHPQ